MLVRFADHGIKNKYKFYITHVKQEDFLAANCINIEALETFSKNMITCTEKVIGDIKGIYALHVTKHVANAI